MQTRQRQTDRRRNGHTVETGHNVGLTAITSKVIWTPDGRRQNHRKKEKGRECRAERKDAREKGEGESKRERDGEKKAERTLGQQHNDVQQKQRIALEAPLCLFQDRFKPASLGRWKEVRERRQW